MHFKHVPQASSFRLGSTAARNLGPMTAADATSLVSRISKRVSHNDAVAAAIAVGQTLGFGPLLITWVAVKFGPVLGPRVGKRAAHGGRQQRFDAGGVTPSPDPTRT